MLASEYPMEGKVALITGGSRGIGRAVALQFAKAGVYVYVNYRQDKDAAEQTLRIVKNGGGDGALCPFDVTDRSAVREAVETILKDRGHLDILVNNAGVTINGLIMRTRAANWARLIDINLNGAFNCCQAVSRPMIRQRGGRIINVTSVVAEAGNAGQTAYAASKAGILGLTKSLARELGAKNICVNAVSPGLIATDMTSLLTKSDKERLRAQIPLRREGKPEDVAGAVFFLASPQADYITGQVIRINGGLYM